MPCSVVRLSFAICGFLNVVGGGVLQIVSYKPHHSKVLHQCSDWSNVLLGMRNNQPLSVINQLLFRDWLMSLKTVKFKKFGQSEADLEQNLLKRFVRSDGVRSFSRSLSKLSRPWPRVHFPGIFLVNVHL